MIWKLFILSCIILEVLAYPEFQARIPNGNRVPNPCNPEDFWPGVGHKLVAGTGERNPFGLDFYASNKAWTKELCQKDSDGDGKTNGEELGDPNCMWIPDTVPQQTTGLSHPGVCEPLNSVDCIARNSWLNCPKNFSCPDFDLDTTKSMEMIIQRTAVPAQETTYMCFGFQMPNDTKYHAIGTVPKIDNKEVMHHMLLYGCTNPLNEQMMTTGVECTMGVSGCQTIIGLWGPGTGGECHPNQYGFPVGASGYQYLLLQMHWNNPGLISDMTDASGMTLYYTDQLRENDAMVIMTGQQYLEIPPKQQSVVFEGTCSSQCTNLINPQTVHISASILHMHLLGKSGSIEVLRDGKVQSVLANQTSYDYNTPVNYIYEPPVEFKAGDEIRVTCDYQSEKVNKTVYWGEGTQDEMCYGFITIYPAVAHFDFCGEYKELVQCSLPSFDFLVENGCKIEDFHTSLEPIVNVCSPGNCSEECMTLMAELNATGCMKDSMWEMLRQWYIPSMPDSSTIIVNIESCWPKFVDAIPPSGPSSGAPGGFIFPVQVLYTIMSGAWTCMVAFNRIKP